MFFRALPWVLLFLVALPDARAGEPEAGGAGTLRIVTSYWADVYVDGKRMGRAPMKALSLPAGRHVVSLLGNVKVNHYRREVVIRPGEITELRVDPDSPEDSAPVEPSEREPTQPPSGTLLLETRYWASVYVDGEYRGRVPMEPLSLPAGRHVIELRDNPKVKPYRREVLIRTGETTTLDADAERAGDFVSVEPSGNEPTPPRASTPGTSKEGGLGTLRLQMKYWADVYVDGKRRGRAPMPPISLPVGRHVIELRGNPNIKDYRTEVVIRAGESLSLTPEPKPVN